MPFRLAWLFPERTIASVAYHCETPTWPVADYANLKGETVLQVSVNGEAERGDMNEPIGEVSGARGHV